jgi:hypothetical protein
MIHGGSDLDESGSKGGWIPTRLFPIRAGFPAHVPGFHEFFVTSKQVVKNRPAPEVQSAKSFADVSQRPLLLSNEAFLKLV